MGLKPTALLRHTAKVRLTCGSLRMTRDGMLQSVFLLFNPLSHGKPCQLSQSASLRSRSPCYSRWQRQWSESRGTVAPLREGGHKGGSLRMKKPPRRCIFAPILPHSPSTASGPPPSQREAVKAVTTEASPFGRGGGVADGEGKKQRKTSPLRTNPRVILSEQNTTVRCFASRTRP